MVHRTALQLTIAAVTLALAGAAVVAFPADQAQPIPPTHSARSLRPVELAPAKPAPAPNLEWLAPVPSLEVDVSPPVLSEIDIQLPTGICGVGCEGPCELEVSADGVVTRHHVIPALSLQYGGNDEVIYWGSGNRDEFEVTVIDRKSREVLFTIRKQHTEPVSPLNWVDVAGDKVIINFTQFMAMGRLPERTEETYHLRSSKLLDIQSSEVFDAAFTPRSSKMTTVTRTPKTP